MDNHALRLLKENYSLRNKRYVSIELPYCSSDEIPEEARLFKKLALPDNLDKLVRYLHDINFAPCFTGPSQFLIESIDAATMDICRERQESAKNIDETDGLLLVSHKTRAPSVAQEVSHEDPKPKDLKQENFSEHLDEKPAVRYYKTDIQSLNLLGDSEEPEEIKYRTPVDGGFCIDDLDL